MAFFSSSSTSDLFAKSVSYAVSKVERRESCSSRSNYRLYATCTKGEMCFCGYQRVSANLFAMKSYPSCSTVS